MDNVARAIEILEAWMEGLEYSEEPCSDGYIDDFHTDDREIIRDAIFLLRAVK